MIIYGTKGKIIEGKPVENVQCPSCGSESLKTFGIIQYFHIYWIPFFPTSKEVGVECEKCKGGMNEENMPSHIVEAVKSSIFDDYDSLHLFTGLIIVLLIFAVGIGVGLSNSLDSSEYIGNPRANDRYVVNLSKIIKDVDRGSRYGVFRVVDVNGENVSYQIGKMGYSSSTAAKKIITKGEADSSSYYVGKVSIVKKGHIQKMYDDGVIRYVIRQ